MHKLKKYPNRRLYDMTDSQYVTVDDVRNLIVKGESIEVVDSKDGSDLTRSVLLQILAEQEQEGHGTVLTNRTIEQLIRFYGDRFGRVVSRYIEEAVRSRAQRRRQVRQQIGQGAGRLDRAQRHDGQACQIGWICALHRCRCHRDYPGC